MVIIFNVSRMPLWMLIPLQLPHRILNLWSKNDTGKFYSKNWRSIIDEDSNREWQDSKAQIISKAASMQFNETFGGRRCCTRFAVKQRNRHEANSWDTHFILKNCNAAMQEMTCLMWGWMAGTSLSNPTHYLSRINHAASSSSERTRREMGGCPFPRETVDNNLIETNKTNYPLLPNDLIFKIFNLLLEDKPWRCRA